jgi:FkbM family methyltransferase
MQQNTGARRFLRRIALSIRGAVLSRVEPYLFVEVHSERLFWKYLAVLPEGIQSVVIVGAWQGAEIPDLLNKYSRAEIVAFEPSKTHYPILAAAYRGNQRVRCFQEAISDVVGEADFHEGSLPGSGSLLPLGQDDRSRAHNLGLVEIETFRVRVSTLDAHEATRNLSHVDLLKIDVQGAEEAVLDGGRKAIARTSAVLVEVSLSESAYVGSTRFDHLVESLHDSGLVLCALGVDPVTLDGNALFIRRLAAPHRSEE